MIKNNAKQFSGHPAYTYKKVGEDFIVLVITHDKNNSNKSKVKTLENNLSSKDNSKSKIHKKANIISQELCSGRLKGWEIKGEKDKNTIKKIIADNKGKKLKRIEKRQ